MTVEAAAYRGRPVSFEIVGPWTAASREPGESSDDGRGPLAQAVILALLVSNVALAILGRAVPQLNVMMVSFPITIGVGLIMLGASLVVSSLLNDRRTKPKEERDPI